MAAENGNSIALKCFSFCYMDVEDGPANGKEALARILEDIQQHDFLGVGLWEKINNVQRSINTQECVKLSELSDKFVQIDVQLAKLGYSEAQQFLESRSGGAGNAAEVFRIAAEHGHAAAQFALGDCYLLGAGVSANYEDAVKWYRLAADQGHTDAQLMLGCCHLFGLGTTRDKAVAAKWYRMAAENENAIAKRYFSFCYEETHDWPADENEALEAMEQAGNRVTFGCLNSTAGREDALALILAVRIRKARMAALDL